MQVTEKLNASTLLGVPILVQSGEGYGTLCALDSEPRKFTENEINLFSVMGRLLGYVIDVDMERHKMQTANVPLVPIGKGVIILPLTGTVTEERAEAILSRVLAYCTEETADYMIIDVSGLVEKEEAMTDKLLYLVNCLELVGTTAIIIGVRPDQAVSLHAQQMMAHEIIIKPSMEEALNWVGLKVERK
jgi:rsbT co-antagonist protein RsbR